MLNLPIWAPVGENDFDTVHKVLEVKAPPMPPPADAKPEPAKPAEPKAGPKTAPPATK